MPTLVFATNNAHKIAEVQAQLGDQYSFLSLKDINCTEDIPETTGTIPGNARQKARFVKDNYGHDCFSEDTGLEIDALDGRPGVDTAHYAGPARDAKANNDKVLAELAGKEGPRERAARFRTVICLIKDGEEHLFEGVCPGHIATRADGDQGFGYDPIFVPAEGDGHPFAQMTRAEKQTISHRGRAVRKLVDFLATNG